LQHGASIRESPFCPKGALTYEVVEDRKEDERDEKEIQAMKVIKKSRELILMFNILKGKKLYYEYKKQIFTDKNGILLSVHAITINRHDSKILRQYI
jgi:hypothetical protein